MTRFYARNGNLRNAGRRRFLKTVMVGIPAMLLPSWTISHSLFQETRTARAKKVFRRLHGPLAAITVPYNPDYSVDHDALHRWVDYVCESRPPILFFTYGDGEVDGLSEEEIARINVSIAKRARGRALVVGATGAWWTGRTADFVRKMEDSGLDAINVHFNPRIRSVDELYPAFEEIAAKTDIPLLIYDNGDLPTATIVKLASIPQVVGIKSHADLYAFYDQVRQTAGTHFAVLGAGQMKQYLYGGLIGSPGYLCPIAPIAPAISWEFYNAVRAGNEEKARSIITEYEQPLLRETIPLKYPQAYKAMLYFAGIYKTNLVRPPRITPPTSSLESLGSFLKHKAIIK
jgi:dihydrodipicolinate synthase/N-acetylneuraminate lyase